MSKRQHAQASYESCFSAQLGALGAHGQAALRQAHVLVIGVSGLGSPVALALAGVGVGRLSLVDPQTFEIDNFNRVPFASRSDFGAPKVAVVAERLARRNHLNVTALQADCEAPEVEPLWNSATATVSASNTVSSRMYTARRAVELRTPCLSVAVSDASRRRSGLVVLYRPDRPDLACPGCLLSSEFTPEGHESVVATVALTLAAFAADILTRFLTHEALPLPKGNVLAVDLDAYRIEAFAVRPRPDCPACGHSSSRG